MTCHYIIVSIIIISESHSFLLVIRCNGITILSQFEHTLNKKLSDTLKQKLNTVYLMCIHFHYKHTFDHTLNYTLNPYIKHVFNYTSVNKLNQHGL